VAVCRGCPLREHCTRNKGGRQITRWKHEHVLEAMRERVRARPEVLKRRQEVVEHPFGTMKRSMDAGYFLLKGRAKVGAEMSLTVLCYNLLRAVNTLGVKRLIEAIEAVLAAMDRSALLSEKLGYFRV
jgi:IS5 family transposase